MTRSRDIESLFARFGGNAGDYQEVRAEAEADDARARWPLLGVLDPIEQRRIAPPGETQASRARAPASWPLLGARMAAEPARVDEPAPARAPVAAPSVKAAQPGPLLKKLFSAPPEPAAEPAPEQAVPLERLFDRLRGGGRAAGAPDVAPGHEHVGRPTEDGRLWFIGGVRRS